MATAPATPAAAERVDRAFVFGSVASGKETAGSDVDLMIIGDVGLSGAVNALYPVQETLGREVDPKIYRSEEWACLRQAGNAFAREVLAKPVLDVIGGEGEPGVGISLERIPADAAVIGRLLSAAGRNIADAHVAEISVENRFDAAYKAIMQLANAALQANGYRTLTSKPGHHMTMIQTLSQNVALDRQTVITVDTLRKQRNVSDYSGNGVPAALMEACVAHAEDLRRKVTRWLKANRPDLMAE